MTGLFFLNVNFFIERSRFHLWLGEVFNLVKCCVCDREGTILARGFWWCEKHYEIVGEQLEEAGTTEIENMRKEDKATVDLDLEWV